MSSEYRELIAPLHSPGDCLRLIESYAEVGAQGFGFWSDWRINLYSSFQFGSFPTVEGKAEAWEGAGRPIDSGFHRTDFAPLDIAAKLADGQTQLVLAQLGETELSALKSDSPVDFSLSSLGGIRCNVEVEPLLNSANSDLGHALQLGSQGYLPRGYFARNDHSGQEKSAFAQVQGIQDAWEADHLTDRGLPEAQYGLVDAASQIGGAAAPTPISAPELIHAPITSWQYSNTDAFPDELVYRLGEAANAIVQPGFAFSTYFSGNVGAVSDVVKQDMRVVVEAALTEWGRFIGGLGTIDVEIKISTELDSRFSGGWGSTVVVGNVGGRVLVAPPALYELKDGVDRNGALPEIVITVSPGSYLNSLWWDKTPLRMENAVPPTMTDGMSVAIHELAHGFGIAGYRTLLPPFLPSGGTVSTYDQLIQGTESGKLSFVGSNAVAAYGGLVPVTSLVGDIVSQNVFHLGNTPFNDASNPSVKNGTGSDGLLYDLMNGTTFYLGERYDIGRLDLAILRDLGYDVTIPSDMPLVNLRDGVMPGLRGTSASDTLTGTPWHERLDGLGGNDSLSGGAGNDVLDGGQGNDFLNGGAGDDTALFSSIVSTATIRVAFDGVIGVLNKSGRETDRIVNIEELQFSDIVIATHSVLQFRPLDYIASHNDLIVNLGSNSGGGYNHYLDYGYFENRIADDFRGFDYLASYDDLIRNLGSNEDAAARHFITNGFGEGRSRDNFDARYYLGSYVDLRTALGANEDAAARHFVSNGFAEGRARNAFSPLEYIASYSDLIRSFGANANAGDNHFRSFGFGEGRGDNFDGLQYIASYGDLIGALGANIVAGTAHFIQHGFSEGRSRDSFDAARYLASYADLRAAFGADQNAATIHYIQYGYAEGRMIL